jgi:hypothetical protein
MRTKALTFSLLVAAVFSLTSAIAQHINAPTHAQGTKMTHIAKGTFTVKLQPMSFEGADISSATESKLARMSIDKEIVGDLVATTKGQMLSAMTGTKGSAGYVAIERVTGTLAGKRGSFVLQHTGTMNRGTPSLTVSVVPDSATDELIGLEGDFKIIIADGKHSYEFSYRLVEK